MDSVLYQRIVELCAERGITINKLESDLGMGNSVIRKWRQSTPSADKIAKVATYFNVSVDYLLGRTDVRTPASELLGDEFRLLEKLLTVSTHQFRLSDCSNR